MKNKQDIIHIWLEKTANGQQLTKSEKLELHDALYITIKRSVFEAVKKFSDTMQNVAITPTQSDVEHLEWLIRMDAHDADDVAGFAGYLHNAIYGLSKYYQGVIMTHYITDFNKQLRETKVYKTLADEQKVKFQEFITKSTNIKYQDYYKEFEDIQINKNYTQEERNKALDLDIANIRTYRGSFFILAERHRSDSVFISRFDEGINFDNYSSLDYCADKFITAYKSHNRRNKQRSDKLSP